MIINLHAEVCCDYCNEVIHNHIDICPECHEEYAGTDIPL